MNHSDNRDPRGLVMAAATWVSRWAGVTLGAVGMAIVAAGGLAAPAEAALVSVSAPAPAPAPAAASPSVAAPVAPPQLGLIAVGQADGYFSVTMTPGETKQLQVQLVNPGLTPATARSFRTDTYTLTNGGFGARASTDAPSGATTWVDYPGEITTLAAGDRVIKTLSVTVPKGTPPGEYISSLVAESGAISPEEVAAGATQIVRTAVAISIRVPGALKPKLAVEGVSQQQAAGQTTLTVALRNTGNERLAPAVRLVVRNANNVTVFTRTIPMGSFYAGTRASVDTTLSKALPVGMYTMTVAISDRSSKLRSTSTVETFTVPGTIKTATGHQWASYAVVAALAIFLIAAMVIFLPRVRARALGKRMGRAHTEADDLP